MLESSVYDPFLAACYAAHVLWYTVTEIETPGMKR